MCFKTRWKCAKSSAKLNEAGNIFQVGGTATANDMSGCQSPSRVLIWSTTWRMWMYRMINIISNGIHPTDRIRWCHAVRDQPGRSPHCSAVDKTGCRWCRTAPSCSSPGDRRWMPGPMFCGIHWEYWSNVTLTVVYATLNVKPTHLGHWSAAVDGCQWRRTVNSLTGTGEVARRQRARRTSHGQRHRHVVRRVHTTYYVVPMCRVLRL